MVRVLQRLATLMSAPQLESLRVPVALALLLIFAILFWPRGAASPAVGNASPSPGVVAGEPGGEVVGTPPTVAQTTPAPSPTATAVAAPEPTALPTEAPPPPLPPAEDSFSADILVCRSVSGSECNDEISTLSSDAASITALVPFSDARAGDQLNAALSGPSGTIAGSPYTLQGGGDGYFWAEFQVGGLPAGTYVVTALRNGEQVATTGFTKDDD